MSRWVYRMETEATTFEGVAEGETIAEVVGMLIGEWTSYGGPQAVSAIQIERAGDEPEEPTDDST